MKIIYGRTVFIELSGGFWGIIDLEGKKWLPIDLPEELQKTGLAVRIKAKITEDYYSVALWGTPVQIMQFEILT